VPAAAREKLRATLAAAARSPEFVAFAESVGLNLAVADAPEFQTAVASQSQEVAALMKRLGAAP
jgi:tripartite-type tricarboxylate transporter receptor subunit TctC